MKMKISASSMCIQPEAYVACMQTQVDDQELHGQEKSLQRILQHCRVAECLLQHYAEHDTEFSANFVDSYTGKTTLMYAVESGFYPAVTAILHTLSQYYASQRSEQDQVLPTNWPDKQGKTVMHYWATAVREWAQ